MEPRTGDYAYAVGVWDLSIVRTILCRAVRNPNVSIRNFCFAAIPAWPNSAARLVRGAHEASANERLRTPAAASCSEGAMKAAA